jgi:glutamine amidotransferase
VTVAVVDYGAGNLGSVRRAFESLGARVMVAQAPADVQDAALLVVPGVGHFAAAKRLDRWRPFARERAAAGGAVLAICLGMQWLFEGSDEAPDVPGLGLFRGACRRLSETGGLKIPHVGWNGIDRAASARPRLLAGIPAGAFAYFTHAYAAPVGAATAATSTYGETFSSAVEAGCVFGTQFHPEKSGAVGLAMLANVLEAAAGERR